MVLSFNIQLEFTKSLLHAMKKTSLLKARLKNDPHHHLNKLQAHCRFKNVPREFIVFFSFLESNFVWIPSK